MRYVCSSAAAFLALTFLSPSLVLGQNGAAGLSIDNYQFVSEQRSTRSEWFVTYRADLVNTGLARAGVVATVTSLVPSIKVVAGQSTLHFAPVPANSRVTSADTFTILVDRTVPFDFANLKWLFLNPVANPGPDQTAAVGTTINLDGGGSTNPSGVGTLTYSWAFASKPAGSNATLTTPHNVTSSFVIDIPGNYVISLTVDNGSAQDTRSVKISTVNSPPVAKAGANQTVAVGSTANLNGSASFDVDGDPLSYTWTFVSVPAGSNAPNIGIAGFKSVTASFIPDKPGAYIVQLVVNDGKADSAASTVTITAGAAANTPPVANAGPNQSAVSIGATVQLNGSASTDVDGDPLTYKWTLITVPSGSTAQLSSLNSVTPTFVADKAGTYVAQLIVNDGKIDSAASTVTITTTAPVTAPTANAGANQTVLHGTTVTLNGSGTDPQNLPLTFSWTFNSKPAGSAATLSNPTAAKPTFVADKPGPYVLQLIVNNGTLNSLPSTVTITTTNTAPVANAGPNQTVNAGSIVNLNGGGSVDADNDPLTYSWSFTSRPAGSSATLSAANSKTPTFVTDVVGPYVVQLIVNDGFASSDPVTVTITATGQGDLIVPATLTIAPNQTLPYNISLAQPALTDISVQLQNSDSTKATLSTTSVSIPTGQTTPSRQVFITGVAAGNLTITATAPGRTPATTNVTVGLTATLTPSTLTIPGPSADGTLNIQLSGQAQSNLSFTIKSSNPNVLSVPSSVPLSTGSTSTGFKVTRVSPGTAIVTVSAPGFADMTSTVTVEAPGSITLSLANTNLYLWQPQTLTITLSTPAPATGTLVTLVADPKFLDVVPKTITVPQGGKTATVQVTGVQVGNPTIGATAPGFTAAAPVNVQVGATIAWVSPTKTVPSTTPQTFVELSLFATVPGGTNFDPADGIQVQFTSSRPDVAAFLNSTMLFLWDGSTVPTLRIPVNILGPGTTILKAKGTNIPEVSMTLIVTGPLAISTAALPSGVVNSAYSFTVAATGGVEPYIWSATGLPANLTINSATGQITGTPTATGTSTVNVTVKDASQPQLIKTAPFQLEIKNATATSLAVSSGSNQSAKINTAFASPLKAIVKDANGNPVSGILVTFTTPANGAGGSFAGNQNTAMTDASGIATSAVFTANATTGAYSVGASINNGALTTSFSLTNTIGDPASIAVSSGAPQSAQLGGAFALPLKAIVKDAGGNPVSGVSVTFAAPANGAGGTFAGGQNTATTDANGIASSALFTANNTQGSYNVSATVTNNPALNTNFALTNTVGTPTSIAVSAGAGQSAKINTAFALALKALVKDANGIPLPGITVTFAAPGSGASATFAGGQNTAVTDASGIATTVILTANGTAGAYSVTATAGAGVTTTFGLTNTPGDPISIAVSSGAPQSAQLGGAFALPLKAIVKDAGGNPVPNVSVTFTAPANGATGTFAGGQTTATANTDANGIATSALFTANTTAGSYNVSAKLTNSPAVTTNFALTNTVGTPASIAVSAGAGQSAKINTAFALALKALVKDANGNPLPGITVSFTAPGSGASAAFAGGQNTAVTDANGIATTAILTANATAGAYSVTATAGAGVTTTFALTNTPGDPATIAVSSGAPQSALLGAAFTLPLKAIVKDAGGNPLPNVSVTFAAPANGASGTFAGGQNTATTDVNGIATSAVFTANNTAGPYNVSASVTANPAVTTNFALTNTALPPASIAASSGAGQSAKINTAFGLPLKALVKDANGNPVAGVTVTFTLPASGAGAAFAGGQTTAVTDANGIATTVVLTANGTVGSFSVTATAAAGVTTTFALTNTPGDPASIAVSSGTPQSAQLAAAFALPLKALVKDAGGNPVPNVSVTFTAPANGASGTFAGGQTTATANTDAAGIATSAVFTANNTTGTYNVSAAVTNNPALTTNFALTNTALPPASIAVSSGAGQSAKITAAYALPLKALVKDANGNPVVGVTVTFSAPGSGASVTFAGNQNTAVTDANGIATSVVLTANSTVGAFSVTATAAPGVTTTFGLTNLAGDLATLTPVSGTPQETIVGTQFAAPLKVLAKDAGGNPVSGAVVTFATPAQSGASAIFAGGQNTATTDVNGIATSAALTANNIAGAYTVPASSGAVSTPFSLTNKAGAPSSLTIVAGSAQSAPVNTAFATLLKASVKDANGNPVSGVTLTFTAPASGASGTFTNNQTTTTSVTDAAGIGTASVFTANNTPGNYTVSVTGINLPVLSFLMTNSASPATSIEVTGGTSPQSAPINSVFTNVLKVLVKGANGNPLNGVTVNFTVLPASNGAGGAFLGGVNTAVTDASGIASSVPFSANSKSGAYQIKASPANNVNLSAMFDLTNTPGPPCCIAVVAGSNQTVGTNTPFPIALQAVVTDAGGNLLRAVPVTFTGPASGAGGRFPNGTNEATVSTDSAGIATAPVFTSNGSGGSYTVFAALPNGQKAGFALTNTGGGGGGLITATNASIGKNLQDTITITLDPPAPNGLPVTITSKDPTKVLVGNSFTSFTVNLLEGTASFGTTVQALSDTGTVIVEISAPNYNTATATITLAPSGFYISGPNSGVGGAFDAFQKSTTQLTVFAARLNQNGTVAQTQQLRNGLANLSDPTSGPFTVRVPVSVNVPSLGSLSASFVTLTGGSNSATVNFVASSTNTGATDILVDNPGASSVCSADYIAAGKSCPPVAFTTPAVGNKITATVRGSSLIPFSATVGKNLQKAVRVGLTGPAPANITITITSTDPAKVKFAKKSTDIGSASIDVTIPTNFSNTPDFFVQAFDSTGSVPYTISSPSNGTSGGNVILGPSGFAIESPAGLGAANFQIQKGGGDANLVVFVGLISGGIMTESQLVAPGVTIPVTVQSGNTNAGTITASPINIVAGTDNAVTQFHPVDVGTAGITASSPGYQPASVAATVTQGKLVVSQGMTIGKFLQDPGGYVILPQAATGPNGVVVHVQSNSPSLKLSTTQAGAGSDFIDVTVPAGQTFAGFFVQSFASTGSGTFTASTALFASATSTVQFAPSAILMLPDNVSGPVNGTGSVSVFPVALVDGGFSGQPLAGGQPLDVTLHSTNSAIASVPGTVTIPAGAALVQVTIQFKSVGGATISLDQPVGFTTPPSFTSTTVTVTP